MVVSFRVLSAVQSVGAARCACVLSLAWLLGGVTPPAVAKPKLPHFAQADPDGTPPEVRPGGILGAADQDTVRFGGTFWNADSLRWEALRDSMWTFDTGVGSHYDHSAAWVNPFKDPSLHASMEGWWGIDVGYSGFYPQQFRRVGADDPRWNPVCVGAAAGLGGSWSFWAGVFEDEAADQCYAAGQGYGNAWRFAIRKTFAYPGSGSVTLEYDFTCQSEPGFDFCYAQVDTGGGPMDLVQYHGLVSGHETLLLTPGVHLPTQAGPVTIRFLATSDGAYSDEDGLHPSACGAFAVDNVRLTGAVASGPDTFESGDDGWALAAPDPGPGGDWSHLAGLNDLPPPMTACPCALYDSVLVFEDITVDGHNDWQDNIAGSPWIDLKAAGQDGKAGKVIRFNTYWELPLLNYIYPQWNMRYKPYTCYGSTEPRPDPSPWFSNGWIIWFPAGPQCTVPGGAPTRIEFSDIIPADAEQVQIALGVISFCRFFANCTGTANSTPWFDNVCLEVYGNPDAPFLNASGVDLPQDSFPQNGTLQLDASGRVDCNNVKGDSQPEIGTALGDTLIVAGGGSGPNGEGVEVRIQFAVDFGPGAPPGATAWLAKHQVENFWRDQQWYSARMDSAEQAGSVNTWVWMSAYHESDPNFVDLGAGDRSVDPDDPYPNGYHGRLANDIFPEGGAGLFTMGTRVSVFYKARYVDAGGQPTTGVWFVFPDTSKAPPLEMEVLPSSAGADSTWNCVLYVDHFNRGAQGLIEQGLAGALSGGSNNFEDVPWDRWDVNAESSQQASFGRPGSTVYGASLQQVFAYRTIVWNSGNLSAFNLVEEDANVLIPWLNFSGGAAGAHHLYLSGDGIARSMTLEQIQEPAALTLLNDWLGVRWTCDTVRDPSCPGTPAVQDLVACIDVDPTLGGHFVAGDGTSVLEGNGCPQRRSFDVLGTYPQARGNPRGNETYWGPAKGMIPFHSVSNLMDSGASYRSVVDGGSVHYRRGAGCADPAAALDRITRVMAWFGYPGSGAPCSEIPQVLGDPPPPGAPPVTSLGAMAPNPLRPGSGGTVRFTLAEPGPARIEVLDIRGRLVRVLVDGAVPGGEHEARWDGSAGDGRAVATGVYFLRLRTAGGEHSRKLVVVGG